jgi:hypothetical protein
MNRNLSSLDLLTLKAMYEAEAEKLSSALLNGATWEETREQRKEVTELSIALHKMRFPQPQNPAEGFTRRDRKDL